VAKAQADTRTLASSVSIFAAHIGALPAALTDLTQQTTNGLGQLAGPFMARVPTPPPGGSPVWTGAYTYTSSSTGTFTITASGDNTTITVP
jgi:hypothetical protein